MHPIVQRLNRLERVRSLLVASLLAAGACGAPDRRSPTDVEPPPPWVPPAEAVAWLDDNVEPLDGTHLSLPHDDLEVLRELVGDARVVSLGENTHGTRDFFEMKARILRFLVEEMGFEAFMIEATWPESNRLDDYVVSGEGDSEELLTGLYFWTWRTESVLEMIEWMREHNAGGGSVRFLGFDMQYPGMALHNVVRYVLRVDAGTVPETQTRLSCLKEYANDHRGRFPVTRYAQTTAQHRDECLDSLNAEGARLVSNRDAYIAASSERDFDMARHSLRVAIQYHEMVVGARSRDESMAKNTIWWANQLGPDSKVVLWAHNFHVADLVNRQGRWLRDAYGDDMVVVFFSHEEGDFTAVTQRGGSYFGLATHRLSLTLPESFEGYFGAAQSDQFLLDLRSSSGPGSGWLTDVRKFRSIGCCFNPNDPTRYWRSTRLADVADLIIHLRRTRATTLLPARYPTGFDPR